MHSQSVLLQSTAGSIALFYDVSGGTRLLRIQLARATLCAAPPARRFKQRRLAARNNQETTL